MTDKMRKYAKLLLQAVKLEDKKYLFLDLPNFLGDFEKLLLEEAKNYDLREVYVNHTDPYKEHDLMLELDQENINKHPLFDNSIRNKYAKLDAAFLFILSMVPNLMDDIDPKKISETNKHRRSTEKYFRDLYEGGKLNWCIAAASNKEWALKGLKISENELWDKIYEVCLVDNNTDPYTNWLEKFKKMENTTKKLNEYSFEYLKYTNEIGTDLKVYLPAGHIWCTGLGIHGEINNMPTEEIFTSPLYNKTEGIVYSAKPLFYNGVMIEDFYLKFEKGKVVDFDAKSGRDILEGILTNDENAPFLGECALVSYDSPINNTGIVFKEILFDENASCHLAIGMGFNECNEKALELNREDLRDVGINTANIHVDFMIGDKTLNIIGVKNGEEVQIMKDGNIII
ncbi:MAG: aminopeptidase [Erysipelotrichales bacterium]|nr:aminopeptidase [Erysipelotrichales bacterium]